ncbi:B2 protein, partial [Sesamum angolense]
MDEDDNDPQTMDECQHRNDWKSWKKAIQDELDSLNKREVFGPIIPTPKGVKPVSYKWVFVRKRNEQMKLYLHENPERLKMPEALKSKPRHMYSIKLKRSLYGLKQSGRMWYNRLKIRQAADYLKGEFEMKDLGTTKYCLGLQFEHTKVRSLDVNKDPFRPPTHNNEILDPEVPYLSAIDAGYLSDPHKAISQSGYVFMYSGTAISWRSTKQTLVATSSNHAELIALYEAGRDDGHRRRPRCRREGRWRSPSPLNLGDGDANAQTTWADCDAALRLAALPFPNPLGDAARALTGAASPLLVLAEGGGEGVAGGGGRGSNGVGEGVSWFNAILVCSMESIHSFWQLGDELRGQSKVSEDHKWLVAASQLSEQTRPKAECRINLDLSKGSAEVRPRDKYGFQEDNKFESFNFNMLNLESKMNENVTKNSPRNVIYNMNPMYQNPNASFVGNVIGGKYSSINNSKEHNNNNSSNNSNSKEDITNATNAVDKRFKTLPAAEMLPRNEVLGGYIFVCNNDTMQEDLKRQLFGLPPRYRDSVRAITPGLPLFLYNYTTHQLHGSNFWGTNIDPTAWEDKKCKGESRFPAQVRIRVRKICKPLEEDAFRPVLHHYDGPKFRLELSVPEVSLNLNVPSGNISTHFALNGADDFYSPCLGGVWHVDFHRFSLERKLWSKSG